jgi:phage terminase large subunit-like protein
MDKLAQAQLNLKNAQYLEGRHLRCRASVPLNTVNSLQKKLVDTVVANVCQVGEEVYFELHPTDPEIPLYKVDKAASDALVSDPKLMHASHFGRRYELRFAETDEQVEKTRWALFDLGIELGPNPAWGK